jgi:membrane fusion protein (multidrug efflux system)
MGTFALTACSKSGGQAGFANRVPTVGVVVIRYQPTQLTAELPGRTSPFQEADVRPQVNGILIKREFEEGGTVHAGQPLYQIDPAPYQATYDSAKAALANAQANLATTRAKSGRYANLLKQSAIAPQDYDDAVAAWKQAEANVLQSQANLESAHINLGYTNITAPITGRIGRSLVTVGALVTANQTNVLATIDTLDPIYVDINQSSSELLALKKALAAGQLNAGTPASARVSLILEDGSAYPLDGTLKFSEASVDPNTGAVVLRAVFPARRISESERNSAAGHVCARPDRRRRGPACHSRAAAGGKPGRKGRTYGTRGRQSRHCTTANSQIGSGCRQFLAGHGGARARRQVDC